MNDETKTAIRIKINQAKEALASLKKELDMADAAQIKSAEIDQHRKDYYTLKSQVERMVQVYGF